MPLLLLWPVWLWGGASCPGALRKASCIGFIGGWPSSGGFDPGALWWSWLSCGPPSWMLLWCLGITKNTAPLSSEDELWQRSHWLGSAGVQGDTSPVGLGTISSRKGRAWPFHHRKRWETIARQRSRVFCEFRIQKGWRQWLVGTSHSHWYRHQACYTYT